MSDAIAFDLAAACDSLPELRCLALRAASNPNFSQKIMRGAQITLENAAWTAAEFLIGKSAFASAWTEWLKSIDDEEGERRLRFDFRGGFGLLRSTFDVSRTYFPLR